MAKSVGEVNLENLSDNIYVSKRSYRKAFTNKRHYIPRMHQEKESNCNHGNTPSSSADPIKVEKKETNSLMLASSGLQLCIKPEPVELLLSEKFSELSPKEDATPTFAPPPPLHLGSIEPAIASSNLNSLPKLTCVQRGTQSENGQRSCQRLRETERDTQIQGATGGAECPQKRTEEEEEDEEEEEEDQDEDEDGAASDGRVEEDRGKEGPKEHSVEAGQGEDKGCLVFPAMKKRGVEGDMENRPYKCTHCNWAFTKSSNLISHIRTHSGLKPHVCELCGKAYSHQGTLQQHKRLHTGERPYHCPFCEKTYIWSSDYRKHIRTHTGEKPYACDTCGKDFVRSSDLRKHERNMHANNKPFPCTKCGRTFNKPLSLLRHERTHLGKRPFICPECGKAFAMPSRMLEHRKVHSGIRPYVCPVCNKAFTKSSNLMEHQAVHSGLRPHKCDECGMAFAMASRLVRHQRVHSGE